jgi:hypothetical protein
MLSVPSFWRGFRNAFAKDYAASRPGPKINHSVCGRTISTGRLHCVSTPSATEPRIFAVNPGRVWPPMQTTSALKRSAAV